MKRVFALSILLASVFSHAADTVIRCQLSDKSGNAETFQVNFVRYENGNVKLYQYVGANTNLVKEFDSKYTCVVEGAVSRQTK